MKIDNAVVLITGGASGLGKSIVEQLLLKGATVVSIDRVDVEVNEINNEKLISIKANITDDIFFQNIIPQLFEKYKFNVLINNAGILHNQPLVSFGKQGFVKLTNEELELVMNVNLITPIKLCREFAEHMIRNRTKGVLINISSISALGNIGQSAYSVSKAGIESFTKVISKELGPWGIRSACLAPGYMNTPSTHNVMNEEYLSSIVKNVPLRKLGNTNDVALGISFIIENDFFNGKILSIDGGLTI